MLTVSRDTETSGLEVVGVGMLRLKSVQQSDTGVYVCSWNTSTTTDNSNVNVTVTGILPVQADHTCMTILIRGVVVPERGGESFQQILLSQNSAAVNIVYHGWNPDTASFQ